MAVQGVRGSEDGVRFWSGSQRRTSGRRRPEGDGKQKRDQTQTPAAWIFDALQQAEKHLRSPVLFLEWFLPGRSLVLNFASMFWGCLLCVGLVQKLLQAYPGGVFFQSRVNKTQKTLFLGITLGSGCGTNQTLFSTDSMMTKCQHLNTKLHKSEILTVLRYFFVTNHPKIHQIPKK